MMMMQRKCAVSCLHGVVLVTLLCSFALASSTRLAASTRRSKMQDVGRSSTRAVGSRASRPEREPAINRKAFAKLLAKYKQASRELDAEQHEQLRQVVSASRTNLAAAFWNADSDELKDKTFTVVLYHVPPFVDIHGWRAEQNDDPGNEKQTRRPSNGKLTGLTIDMLEELSEMTGCKFHYLYPCSRGSYGSNGNACSLATAEDAFAMLTTGKECSAMSCPVGFWRSGCGNGHAGECLPCSPCQPGEFRSGCSRQSPGACMPCSKGTYASTWGYRSACAACSAACNPSTHNQTRACLVTHDRECTPRGCKACLDDVQASGQPAGPGGRDPDSCGTTAALAADRAWEDKTREKAAVDEAKRLADLAGLPDANRTRAQKGLYSFATYDPVRPAFGSCSPCLVCPPGSYTHACGGASLGTCKACPRGTYTPINKTSGRLLQTLATTCEPCWAEALTSASPLLCPPGSFKRGCGGTNAGECVSCLPDKGGNSDATQGPLVILDPSMACPRGWFRTACGGLESGHCLPGVDADYGWFGGPVWSNVTHKVEEEHFCADNRCLSAGTHQIDASKMATTAMTTAYLEVGYKLVVKQTEIDADLMSWAAPFSGSLWMAVVAEVLVCAFILAYVEGYGTNETMPASANPVSQYLESVYFAVSCLLGGHDKSATTIAGRILFIAHLFFTLILLSVYTGNIASFLINKPYVEPLGQFSDITDVSSYLYSRNTVVCYPTDNPLIKDWIDFEQSLSPDANFKTLALESIDDCLEAVYLDQATCTFYDTPILNARLNADYYSKGKCGNPGGFCSNASVIDQVTCECPVRAFNQWGVRECQNPAGNVWTPINGNLVTVGQTFNPFGYALVFRRVSVVGTNEAVGVAESSGSSAPTGAAATAESRAGMAGNRTLTSWHTAFSQAIIDLRARGVMDTLDSTHIPSVEQLECAKPPEDPEDGDTVLQLENVLGLFYITGALCVVGTVLGQLEAAIRFFIACCPQHCGKAGQAYLDAMQEAADQDEEPGVKHHFVDAVEGAVEGGRDFVYVETDCEAPEEGELLRLNLAHYTLETSARRLKNIERALLKIAISKGLLANAADFDPVTFEKISKPESLASSADGTEGKNDTSDASGSATIPVEGRPVADPG